MTPSPLLILPDFLQPLEIDCHASRVELGVLLMKNHRPIAYFSTALPPTNLCKSAYEKN